MELQLFVIIIILLIILLNKVSSLTKITKSLEVKIDQLKGKIVASKTSPIGQKGDVQVASEVKTTPVLGSTETKNQKNEATENIYAEKKPEVKAENEKILDEKALKEKTQEENVLKENVLETQKPIILKDDLIDPNKKSQDTNTIKTPVKKSVSSQKSLGTIIENKIESFKLNNPDIEKFIGENLISKIGILILVLGISFFVKFAIDNEWINEVARVGIGFLAGGILLGFAHKLQKNYKAFSSILVSGAITIFYFIITYAFKEYALFSQTIAFALLVLITIFSVAISLLYDKKELGILSLIGGFAVPLMASTGDGNYVVLFSYLLVLDLGFLWVSIKKKWFAINVLSFLFTQVFFVSWLMMDYLISEHSIKLFLFATAFFFVFYLMNVLRIIKEKEYAMKPIVMTLFLISTFIYFGQGLLLIGYIAPSFRGAFTLALALVNLITGWLLFKNKTIDKKTVFLFIGMTLTFLTLVGPIQLKGNYITLFWAVEGTLLIWLSQKMKTNNFKFAALLTTILMLGSLLMDFEQAYATGYDLDLTVILNKGFITGLVAVVTLLMSAFLLHKEKGEFSLFKLNFNNSKVKIGYLVIAGVVLYLTGILELTHQTYKYFDQHLSSTIIAIYNFIFVGAGVFFALRSKKETVNTIGAMAGTLAVIASIVFLNRVPFDSFFFSKLDATGDPTFYVQLILFAITIYMLKLLYDYSYGKAIKTVNFKAIRYIIAALFVTIVSVETLIISQQIMFNHTFTSVNHPDFYYRINKMKIATIKTSLPILWGLLSFAFLLFGIRKNKKEFRIFALALVALTIIKLFTYDIGNVSQGGKIVAFIILGIVLLVISFMYQRIKKLFNDENDQE